MAVTSSTDRASSLQDVDLSSVADDAAEKHRAIETPAPLKGGASGKVVPVLESSLEAQRNKWYRNKLFTVCIFILLTEAMERLTFYTIQGSQRNFLQTFGYGNAQSTSLNSAFNVICYWWAIAGGWAADSKLGKYKVILIGGTTYAVGTYLTAISADPNIRNLPLYFIGTFVFIAAGTGAIKPCVSNFGGDQYDVSDEGERREQESFFNWFYLSINVSAAIAFGYLVTLATNGSGAIPQEWGFTAAYAIAAVAMSLAVLAFFAGRGRYIIKLPCGDVLAGLVTYIVASARQSWRGSLSLLGWILLVVFLILAIVQAFITDEALAHIVSYVALGVAVLCNGLLVATHTTNTHLEGLPESKWLTVEEAKGALDTVPILIVVNVSFSILYNLMPAAFVAQACQMNLSIGSSQINGAFFNIADCFAILIFVPIFEWVLFPAVRFLKGGKDITRSEKLVSGLVMSIAGVMCAVGLEYARRSSPDTGIVSNCAPAGVTMSSLSAFTMMAPFAIVGIGEVLINPVLYYFAYNQAPVRTRSMMQAFNLLCCGAISNAYTAALTTSMTVWFTDDLNNGHLDYFYFANAIIGAMGIPLFFFVSRYYVEKDWESTGKLEAGKAEAPDEATSNKVVDASDISIGSRGLVTFRSMVSRDV